MRVSASTGDQGEMEAENLVPTESIEEITRL